MPPSSSFFLFGECLSASPQTFRLGFFFLNNWPYSFFYVWEQICHRGKYRFPHAFLLHILVITDSRYFFFFLLFREMVMLRGRRKEKKKKKENPNAIRSNIGFSFFSGDSPTHPDTQKRIWEEGKKLGYSSHFLPQPTTHEFP